MPQARRAHGEPTLSPEEKAILDDHIALYDSVAGSAHLARSSRFTAWRERSKTFDYTLGPGLKALVDRTDVDAALIVSGTIGRLFNSCPGIGSGSNRRMNASTARATEYRFLVKPGRG